MDGYREKALENLIKLSERQGYLTIDNIIDGSDAFGLQIRDFDWISNAITTRGTLIYDEEPSVKKLDDDAEYSDYSHVDYEEIFKQVLKLNGSLKTFIDEIREIIPPQYKEIIQLKYQVREGNSHARQRMIEMHLRMAVKIAFQRATAYDMDIEDAISCACIGLINAVDKYDPDGFSAFASYAALWMQQILARESPTQRPLVYYPVHKKEGYFTIYPIIKKRGCLQCNDIGECKKIMQIVTDKLGCTNNQAKDTIVACIPFESIELFVDNITEDEKHDFEKNENMVLPERLVSREAFLKILSDKELKARIQNLLDGLKARERDVIMLRYGLNGSDEKTLEEVGVIFGLTRERIRQIENKALNKLQNPRRAETLIDFY